MKPVIKINFTDFWGGFDKQDNYFYNLLSENYEVVVSDEPDFLFYSCYGINYLKYDCIRIFYTAENKRPDFTGCDFAITFDFIDRKNHFRFPLYGIYCFPESLLGVKSKDELLMEWKQKESFCCMVVSNGGSKKRIDFFHQLSKYRKVDSGGKFLNNIGGPVLNKLDFIKRYKFVFAFENASYPGYTTEKVIEPLNVNSIPVYWGNPLIGKDINKKRILNYDDYKDAVELVQDMLAIENDVDRAMDILSQPVFPDDKVPPYVDKKSVSSFLDYVVSSKNKLTPVAQTRKKIIHTMNVKTVLFKNSVISRLFRTP